MAKVKQKKSKQSSVNNGAESSVASTATKKGRAKAKSQTKASKKKKPKSSALGKSPAKGQRVKRQSKKVGAGKKLDPKASRTNLGVSVDAESDALVKKIWLAGLGAYGLSRDQVLRRGDAFKETGQQLFDSLVERGEEVQDDTSGALNQKIDSLEERIDNIKEQLKDGYTASPVGRRVNHLSKIVEELQAKTKKSRK